MALKRRVEPKPQSPLPARILAAREPGRAEVSLERLEAEFGDASRYEIVASLKALEKAGSGQFVVGRKGQRSRFVWAHDNPPDPPRAAKKAAKGSPRGRLDAVPDADGAPALSSEPRPKGSTRKALVPAGKRLERVVLSSRAAGEAPPRPRSPRSATSDAAALDAGASSPSMTGAARSPAEPRLGAASRTLRHSFHLRPGLLVSIDLPEDVTATEVSRFCSFLEAIPFAGGGRR